MNWSYKLILLALLAGCAKEEPRALTEGFDPANPGASIRNLEAGPSDSTLRFEKQTIVLGDVLQHTRTPLEFPFEVEGAAPLVITDMESSCGCTNVQLEVEGKPYVLTEPIQPGSKGVLKGEFNSAEYMNDKESKITIRGNGQDMPIILRVEAFVHPMFKLTPKEARFGDIPESALHNGKTVEQTIVVSAAEPFEVKRWIHMPPGVQVVDTGKTEVHEDGVRQLRWFQVTMGEGVGKGHIYVSALAETTLGRNVDFVVQANIVGSVRYDPPQRITFGLMNSGQKRTRRVNLRAMLEGLELPVPRLEVIGSEVFQVEITEKDPGKFLVIKVHVEGDVEPGHHNAILRCHWPESTGISVEEWALKAIVR
ncbi:MAG: DUF1573 domain-containing protein [Planctomycetes bacterium]|nr:DUF1573 domain-containing protein [Planctomycetota bacterium]